MEEFLEDRRVEDEGGTFFYCLFLSHFCLQNFALVENLSF